MDGETIVLWVPLDHSDDTHLGFEPIYLCTDQLCFFYSLFSPILFPKIFTLYNFCAIVHIALIYYFVICCVCLMNVLNLPML